MLKASFIAPQKKVVSFEIDNKNVRYYDDFWKHGIQIHPYPKEIVKTMLKSRSGNLQAMGLLIHDANTGKNLEEYEACKTDEEVLEIIRRDCKIKGLKEIE